MRITELLRRQHGSFRVSLREMRDSLKDVQGSGPDRLGRALRKMLPLLAAHEELEHELVFPVLAAAKESVSPEILEIFDREHEDVGRRIGRLLESLQTPEGILGQLIATGELTSLLSEHLEHEEAVLFPLIEKILPESEQARLAEEGAALTARVLKSAGSGSGV